MKLRRILIVTLVAAAYLLVVSVILVFLPFSTAPKLLRAVIPQSHTAALFWMKLRHIAVVGLVAGLVMKLPGAVRHDQRKVLTDSLAIGTVAVLWGIFFRSILIGSAGTSWIEITDYLTVWAAVPFWALLRVTTRPNRAT
ncbi:hypothetical protein L4X63_06975 [Geomonas sp. Red32]|uniref:hypothetical protein n=1 Tax=Geomonas sp. Red32 TaxID=2912856 RepID=UPI00202CC577|nr:hypothetical protein [Geomonas sp. Red32]MCM0081328.1 hypothetical protein [Geomonas sp. Red32]